MNSSLYGKLAVTNIRNNRKTYLPYILTAILTVMMFFVMNGLAATPSMESASLGIILDYATIVIAIFAVIFLFYTNSFLMKRRKKEIGVYNILGMGKGHIAAMMMIETILVAIISIGAGLLLGFLFSRLTWMILLKIIGYNIGMKYSVSIDIFVNTAFLFLAIFALILVYNLVQILRVNTVELLHGSNQGEREPKTKWILTLFGIAALGTGYYIALTTESPLAALSMFLVAVVCVILGTYALFIAGSVAVLKILRRNKSFYYKSNHFVAVSGMIYRMKQNAAGLANICILSTMVLVTVSTTISLYAGVEGILMLRYPQEVMISKSGADESEKSQLDFIIAQALEGANVTTKNEITENFAELTFVGKDGKFSLKPRNYYGIEDVASVKDVYMYSLEDYNRIEKKNITLQENEILLYTTETGMYDKEEICIEDTTYHVAKELKNMWAEEKNSDRLTEAYYIVLPTAKQIEDWAKFAYDHADFSDVSEETMEGLKQVTYQKSFDLEGDAQKCSAVEKEIREALKEKMPEFYFASREDNKTSFYELYGGLLFIGIYLGLMFLMAAVLIIYYKQISEGYEDRERFQIMQKVGMSKREVRRSIRSQVLMVFFLPLIVAVIHVAVAFGVVKKLLSVLYLYNVPLFFTCTVITIAVFAVFYAVVFAVTAREYYKIVD